MAQATIYIPPIEETFATESARQLQNTTPALGPELIRHVVQQHNPEHSLRIVYGEIGKTPSIEDLLRPGDCFFGISATSLSYKPAIPYIREALARGKTVVIGGAHALVAGDSILESQKGVYVAGGNGELVVLDLLNGKDPRQIPGLKSRAGEQERPALKGEYEMYPFLHSTIDYDFFFKNARERNNHVYRSNSANQVISVRGITGCPKKKACTFCSAPRADAFDGKKRGRYLAEERLDIARTFGSQVYIRDCGESIPEQECLEEMARIVNGSLENRVYGSAMVWDLLNEKRFEAALAAGYTDFLLGLEGFSKPSITQTGKPNNTFDLLKKFLKQSQQLKVNIFVSGIVGWPGESPATLDESSATIGEILSFPQVVSLSVNYLLPFPRTAVYNEMVKAEIIDPRLDWFNMFDVFLKHLERNCPQLDFNLLSRWFDKTVSLDKRVAQYMGLNPEYASI